MAPANLLFPRQNADPSAPYCDGWWCYSMPVYEIVGIAVGIVVGLALLCIGSCCFVRRCKRRRREKREDIVLERQAAAWAEAAAADTNGHGTIEHFAAKAHEENLLSQAHPQVTTIHEQPLSLSPQQHGAIVSGQKYYPPPPIRQQQQQAATSGQRYFPPPPQPAGTSQEQYLPPPPHYTRGDFQLHNYHE